MNDECALNHCVENTDRELWRESGKEGDYYSPSISLTAGGGIAINVGGMVYVKTLREWHKLAVAAEVTRAHYVCKECGVPRWAHDSAHVFIEHSIP